MAAPGMLDGMLGRLYFESMTGRVDNGFVVVFETVA